jgi:sulfite exporter TauE/SafE
MPASADLVWFLSLGFIGGFGHCVGMCAPFVLLVSRRFGAPGAARGAAFASQLWYTAGRVATYGVLGALAGFVGGAVELAGSLLGLQRAASILAGAVLVLEGLLGLTGSGPLASASGGRLFARVTTALGRRIPGHPLGLGLLLGLLPCGLLYPALIAAVARGGPLEGATALVAFGSGTAPALLGLSLADELLARHRALVDRLARVFLLLMGAWFVWAGLRG